MEELRCIGCGSILQSEEPAKPGYVSSAKLEEENEDIICRRCFRLKHYHEILPLNIKPEAYFKQISTIGEEDALIVMIVDVFDIEGSLIPQIAKLTNHNDLLLLVNKVDLLPKHIKRNRLLHHIKKIVADNNLKPKEILLMSAKKKEKIDESLEMMLTYANHRDIYVVGATNVGKSTFINALIHSSSGFNKDIITVSSSAGTTLDFIQVPFEDQFIYDTPGLINENQLQHYLETKSQHAISPKNTVQSRLIQVPEDKTLFIGGVARIEFSKGAITAMHVYCSKQITLHKTKKENTQAFYDKHVGTLLTPPFSIDEAIELKPSTIILNDDKKYDIVFPGLGFVTIKGPCTVKAYAHPKTVVVKREAIF